MRDPPGSLTFGSFYSSICIYIFPKNVQNNLINHVCDINIKLKLIGEPLKSIVFPKASDNLNSSVFNNNLLTSIQSWGATTLSIIVNPYSVVTGFFFNYRSFTTRTERTKR